MQDYLAACAYGKKETDLKEEEEKRQYIEALLQEADMWYKEGIIHGNKNFEMRKMW